MLSAYSENFLLIFFNYINLILPSSILLDSQALVFNISKLINHKAFNKL